MATRTRKNVWKLGPADQTLSWYAKAVAVLIRRPVEDPTSWRYLAAIHGTPQDMATPSAARDYWDQCQHQSWFFLPWHRGYLASFEATIAKTVKDVGGPADWALPFWDYSESRSTNPNATLMPPAFLDRTLPDESDNPLWSKRARATGGNFGLDETVVSLSALRFTNFANSRPGVPSGFGGPVSGFNPGGGDNGGVENVPHNRIHVRIGGDTGFMSDPSTAALDPIFWLHHANIDRLWEVWRNQGPSFRDPSDARWLTSVVFAMHDGEGRPITFRCADMLDTTKVLHGYTYDGVPVAQEPGLESTEIEMAGEEMPQFGGESEGPVVLSGETTKADLVLVPASTVEAVRPEPRHVYLNLENITGAGVPGDYLVYLDLPDDNIAPSLAGVMTTFGLERASDTALSHGGSGLTQVFEITDLSARLKLTNADVPRLKVTFVREGVAAADTEAPSGLSEYAGLNRNPPTVRVGRISLFYD
jgi:tyrosinase